MCGYSFLKYILFVFNFIFWLSGVAILGVAIYVKVDSNLGAAVEAVNVGGTNLNDSLEAGAYILIGAGCLMLIVGFFGCCGAIKESACLLGFYFAFLLIIFALEVGIGIWVFVNFSSIEDAVTEGFKKLNASNSDFQETFQQAFMCCGTTKGCADFPGNVPQNCKCNDANNPNCAKISNITGCSPSSSSDLIYSRPCSTAVNDFIDANINILGGVTLGIGLAEMLGMLISMWLCCKIRDRDDVI